jgi:hyperosmotically inducible periplasmic protein
MQVEGGVHDCIRRSTSVPGIFLAVPSQRRNAMTRIRLTGALLALVLLLPLFTAACGKTVGETIDDATITTRVKTALLNDPTVGGLRIDVDTFKGVVTLSGAVKTPQEEQTAIALARKVSGVVDVKSTLQVNPS